MSENRFKFVLFDLDGTLTDSGPGIMRCARYAYEKMNRPAPDPKQLRTFVGPPLKESFARFGVPENETDQAVAYFREEYHVTGAFENAPYPGIEDLLGRLKREGYHLYVATSKLEELAVRVLQHFDMDGYFEMICGGTMDGSRVNKDDVIEYLLEKVRGVPADASVINASNGMWKPDSVVMVGDTVYDVIGARKKGIPCIGVDWGYGNVADMKKEGALCIVSTMEQLHDTISQGCTE